MDPISVKKLIKYPVKADWLGMYILDADNEMIVEVRGWGRLSQMSDQIPEMPSALEKQKAIAQFVAEAINEKLKPIDLEAMLDHAEMKGARHMLTEIDRIGDHGTPADQARIEQAFRNIENELKLKHRYKPAN